MSTRRDPHVLDYLPADVRGAAALIGGNPTELEARLLDAQINHCAAGTRLDLAKSSSWWHGKAANVADCQTKLDAAAAKLAAVKADIANA